MQKNHLEPVFLAGNSRLVGSVAACLLQAGHPVTLYTMDKEQMEACIHLHFKDMLRQGYMIAPQPDLQITEKLSDHIGAKLAIAVTKEEVDYKKDLLSQIGQRSASDTVMAVNTGSIDLYALQEGCAHPERIIGVNWTEPAHTTFFLELIANETVRPEYVDRLFSLAKDHWRKDPYVLQGGYSIRAHMFAAMAREAFYLVQNGYASVEDIDRACRNDAGYYLPFCGNCRYMDLMGTYAYGVVMKELNPDLSKSKGIPAFFNEIIATGGKGMENGKGFYTYSKVDVKKWDALFRQFSYQINKIMEIYPFNYKKRDTLRESISISNQHG